jgi:NAD-dependent SIR2 family protein deacetylase
MSDERVYFLGAGASRQDSFPLSSELRYGIAWAMEQDAIRFARLRAHLAHLYNVGDALLADAARVWESLSDPDARSSAGDISAMPDVIDVLSTLDWMIREQSSFGPGLQPHASPDGSDVAQLNTVRDLVVQALCHAFGLYRKSLASASATQALMQRVRPADSLITTNWDLLIDSARDTAFGTVDVDYGTIGNVALEGHTAPLMSVRPRLLKLHGSLSWRYCPRCQRLVIDPHHHVAGDRDETATCPCTCRFSELIVTPSFVREYRNAHLLSIWREALLALAHAAEWVFIGYSLPPDDVGVRALLLKARCMRDDINREQALRVTVVSARSRVDDTLARYRLILPRAEPYPGDFGQYVQPSPGP